MKVTVCFDTIRVVVPCGDGKLLVRDLMHEAVLRYRKATGKCEPGPLITSLSSLTGGGLLDPDDRLCDVADDREQIVAHIGNELLHAGGDGASSVGTNSPDFFNNHHHNHARSTSGIKRESAKRLSMHALSTREPNLTNYTALSLPRESRRREPLGQDSKTYDLTDNELINNGDVREIIIKNEAGPLGLHVVPCYDLLGNDQGLRVEGIEPNGRISKDGQIDLHDKIISINGNNLLRIPFNKVQDIFRTCMNEKCLKINIIKSRNNKLDNKKSSTKSLSDNKIDNDDNIRKLQCSNYNLLKNANTRKIGKMIDIELIKGTNGLGFSVTTRDNPAGGNCPIYIKNILPKGAAVEDGRLRPGDRLLEVNNIEMTGKSQAEVVSLLRSIAPGGKVTMTVSRQEEIANNFDNSVPETTPDNPKLLRDITRYSSPKKDSKEPAATASSSPTPQLKQLPSDDVMLSPRKNRMILTLDIPVHDSEKAGLGVSVKGKTSSTDDNSSMDLGIFIKSVLNGGAASRDGRLRTNDQLLNVNGVSLLGLSNSEAMETLRRAMLNTNSSVTGVITLTIARRITHNYDNCDGNCKIETANSIFISDDNKNNDNEFNNIDNDLLPSASSASWNPVIDRLTEQYNKNSLRNESYCLATNKTWIDSIGNAKKMIISDNDLLIEETNDNGDCKKIIDDKDSHYDSQLSLEEFNSAKFSRDALGRQSMSEKRHAALDAKNTDTYKRNKKIREGREKENQEESQEVKKSNEKPESSFEAARKKFEKFEKNQDKSEYVYTIPGCNNKYISPRKHWLVDDGHGDANGQFKEDGEGFSNSRGDVKQASLNSALDDRYKRSRKKGGIRSMLRLAFRPVQRQLIAEQRRHGSKINVQKPKKPFYRRGVFNEFVTPYYLCREPLPLWELCGNLKKKELVKREEPHPYQMILARECLDWYKKSRMIAFFHKNSITAEDENDFRILIRRDDMWMKYWGRNLQKLALEGTHYEAVLPLFCSPGAIVFCEKNKVEQLRKYLKKTPQLVLMAGMLDGTLLNVNDFLKYGKMDLTSARVGLLQTLQTAAGGTLCRQLTHHQETLVTRLKQISDGETKDSSTGEN